MTHTILLNLYEMLRTEKSIEMESKWLPWLDGVENG